MLNELCKQAAAPKIPQPCCSPTFTQETLVQTHLANAPHLSARALLSERAPLIQIPTGEARQTRHLQRDRVALSLEHGRAEYCTGEAKQKRKSHHETNLPPNKVRSHTHEPLSIVVLLVKVSVIGKISTASVPTLRSWAISLDTTLAVQQGIERQQTKHELLEGENNHEDNTIETRENTHYAPLLGKRDPQATTANNRLYRSEYSSSAGWTPCRNMMAYVRAMLVLCLGLAVDGFVVQPPAAFSRGFVSRPQATSTSQVRRVNVPASLGSTSTLSAQMASGIMREQGWR